MSRHNIVVLSVLTLCLGFGTLSCTSSPETSSDSTDDPSDSEAAIELTISVAASVQDAMKEIQEIYQAEEPAVAITYNFGSSGSLAQQINQGAPVDVFLSASKKWMDDLKESNNILVGSRQDLLLNSLVLIVPQGQSDVTDFSDLNTDKLDRISIGEPESVPAGGYAKETLVFLQLFDPLQSKMVFGKDVRQVLSYVATGNVDAGLVYATDAKVSDQVQVVATAPPESHSPIVYPVGIVADSDQAIAAQDFISFLSSDSAVAIFEDYGFAMAE